MINFVKAAFRGFFEVILWVILIGCTVGGGMIGYNMTHSRGDWFTPARAGNPIPGILIGLVVGMFINIVFGGFLATIINISENAERLRYLSGRNSIPSDGSSSKGVPDAIKKIDMSNVGFFILSFLIPLAGLILFIVWKQKIPHKAKSCGIGALTGFIILTVIVPLALAFLNS